MKVVLRPFLELLGVLIIPVVYLISLLPFKVLYFMSDGISHLLFYKFKYRREVVYANLKIAFPGKSEDWIKNTARESYRHFCDNLFETLKTVSISKKEILRRYKFLNLEQIESYHKLDRPVIALTGHQANFDWCMIGNEILESNLHSLYKPLKNRTLDWFLRNSRRRLGSRMIPMKKFRDYVKKLLQVKSPGIICIVADQSPKPSRRHHFTSFFNRPTASFTGFEEIGREYKLPLFFARIEKTGRGYYELEAIPMTTDTSQTEELEMIDLFYELLENQIKRQPECYMWTHKRWKVTMENTWGVLGSSPKLEKHI
ncbi:hypothetical protein BST97_02240 [Nonlabens spongiae]|uniref:Lipid A biosynthesis acyltransferase n=1 Tax=Nonlabens spongiae TaxID=331648 RepID=A0A1W6MH53_9FLAO|nr:hypothetical protein [Nonlabens spongiae]ARN76912.1 hypothetical protein BST97_02240 [Nonlabens spongiae]